jgi:hypothetical protein
VETDKIARLAVWLAENLQPGAQPFTLSGLRLHWSAVSPKDLAYNNFPIWGTDASPLAASLAPPPGAGGPTPK